jgi:hypothetical protein
MRARGPFNLSMRGQWFRLARGAYHKPGGTGQYSLRLALVGTDPTFTRDIQGVWNFAGENRLPPENATVPRSGSVRGGGPKGVGLICQRLQSRHALDFPQHRWSDP